MAPSFSDETPDLIVFDGICVLCNGFVRFVHRFDRQGRIRMATAQSPVGRALYQSAGLVPDALETVLFHRQGRILQKSDAILGVVAGFGGLWRLVALGRLVPRPLRDWLYDRVALNRYRLFGRHAACPVPPPDLRARFVEDGFS